MPPKCFARQLIEEVHSPILSLSSIHPQNREGM